MTISGGHASGRPRLGVSMGPKDDLAVAADFGGRRSEIAVAHGPGACRVDIFEGGRSGKPGARARSSFRYAEPGAERVPQGDLSGDVPLLSSAMADAIAQDMRRSIAYDASFYLPAGRAAIIRAYRDLAAGMISDAPRAGSGQGGNPGVQGAVADLVAGIVRLGGRRGGFFGPARRMEREMLSGSVQVSHRAGGGGIPAVSYRQAAAASPCRAPRRRSRRSPPCRCT